MKNLICVIKNHDTYTMSVKIKLHHLKYTCTITRSSDSRMNYPYLYYCATFFMQVLTLLVVSSATFSNLHKVLKCTLFSWLFLQPFCQQKVRILTNNLNPNLNLETFYHTRQHTLMLAIIS